MRQVLKLILSLIKVINRYNYPTNQTSVYIFIRLQPTNETSIYRYMHHITSNQSTVFKYLYPTTDLGNSGNMISLIIKCQYAPVSHQM